MGYRITATSRSSSRSTAKLNTYHVALFALFPGEAARHPDGDGNLLDNSILLYGGGMSNPNVHLHVNLPLVVAGGGAGRLKGGRHLAFAPGDNIPMTNLLVSLLDKAGVRVDTIGDSTGRSTWIRWRGLVATVLKYRGRRVPEVRMSAQRLDRHCSDQRHMPLRCRKWIVPVLAALLVNVGAARAAGVEPSLVDAVKEGNIAAVRAMVSDRADVNAAEVDGTTALHYAAHLDSLAAADLLIRAGANVRAANRYGVTPLWLACVNGSAAMVEQAADCRRGREHRNAGRRHGADDGGADRQRGGREGAARARRQRERAREAGRGRPR